MKKKVKPPLSSRSLRLALAAAAGLTLAYCARTIASFLDGGYWTSIGLLLLLVPALLLLNHLLALVHEIGHMIGGWLTGYRLYGVSVAGWSMIRRGGRICWGYEATPGVGGLCAMVTDRSPRPYVLYILSGALATLLLGGVCAFFAVRTYPSNDLYWDEALQLAVWHVPLTMLAVLGIMTGIDNLVPQRFIGGMSDGMQLWTLSRDAKCRAAWEQAGRIAWQKYQGRTMLEMPDALFVHPPITRDMNPYAANLTVMRLARLIDQQDFSTALSLCHELLDAEVDFGAMQTMCVVRTGALCEVMLGDPGSLCQRMRDKDIVRLMAFSCRTPGTLLCEYAMAKLVIRDEVQAARYRAAYERAVARSPHYESVEADSRLLRRIDERAAERMEENKLTECS